MILNWSFRKRSWEELEVQGKRRYRVGQNTYINLEGNY